MSRVFKVLIVLSLGGLAFAQSASSTRTGVAFIGQGQVPPDLTQQYRVLGDRLEKPGKERVVLTGTLTDRSGSNAVTITTENGSKVSVAVPGDTARSSKFDGKVGSGGNNPTAAKVIESLVDDLPDSLFAMIARGSIVRLLGRGFRDKQGRSCDFYEIPFASKVAPTRAPEVKLACFDTATHLLRSLQYSTGKGRNAPLVEVEFDNWNEVSGQALPGKIVRRDDGALTYTLTFQTSSVLPKGDDNAFKP